LKRKDKVLSSLILWNLDVGTCEKLQYLLRRGKKYHEKKNNPWIPDTNREGVFYSWFLENNCGEE
jgi:hypothetical protein